MGIISDTARQVFRYFVTDGVPASGHHEPEKPAIQQLFLRIDAAMASLGLAILGGNAIAKANTDALSADLNHPAGTLAFVYDDSTAAENGIYIKSGTTGVGGWALTDIALPGAVIGTLTALINDIASNLQANLNQEIADRQQLEANLQNNINQVSTDRLAGDNGLATYIDTVADNLQANLNAEAGTRAAAIAAQQVADGNLADAIQQEAADRIAADEAHATSNAAQFVTIGHQFEGVADQFVGISGQLATIISQISNWQHALNLLNYAILQLQNPGGLPSDEPIENYRVREALRAVGDLQAVLDALDADPTNPVTIRWTGNAPIVAGDIVDQFIATTLGYDDATMAALRIAARAVP